MDPSSAEELELNYLGLNYSRNHDGKGCEAAEASTLVIELLGVVNKVVQDGRKPIVEQDGWTI
jgi:hypothetical protein